jgi:hypothetical protein
MKTILVVNKQTKMIERMYRYEPDFEAIRKIHNDASTELIDVDIEAAESRPCKFKDGKVVALTDDEMGDRKISIY